MDTPAKGSRKLQAARDSAIIIGVVALTATGCSVVQPALAPQVALIIGALGVAIGAKDGAHAWGNAQEHKTDTPPASAPSGS